MGRCGARNIYLYLCTCIILFYGLFNQSIIIFTRALKMFCTCQSVLVRLSPCTQHNEPRHVIVQSKVALCTMLRNLEQEIWKQEWLAGVVVRTGRQ